MLHFEHDYLAGAHPEVLEALVRANSGPFAGYGQDELSERARAAIRTACGVPDAPVYFFSGGTQVNQVALSFLLEPHEGVIAVDSGHIATHESGAIEHDGHKVITLAGNDGKLEAQALSGYLHAFYAQDAWEHCPVPGAVYISLPTELGTLYSRDELAALWSVCEEFSLPLYIDGARLAYALGELSLEDVAACCSAFSIGGTKAGALFGEALVLSQMPAPRGALGRIKQHGALLAKGWLVACQFEALFSSGLYERLGKRCVAQAKRLRDGARAAGFSCLSSPTNQQFIAMSAAEHEGLSARMGVTVWERSDERVLVRCATSWATTDADIEAACEIFLDVARRAGAAQ